MASIYQYDIENRYPTYTLERTVNEDLISYTLKDTGDAIVAHARGMTDDQALLKMRNSLLVGGSGILPTLTSLQRADVTPILGQQAIDNATKDVCVYSGSAWVFVDSV